MTTPIGNTSGPVVAGTTAPGPTQQSTSALPANTGSSITSSAPAGEQEGGFSATISAWIANICDSIRKCLANLPLIGGWFAETTPPTPVVPPVTPLPPPPAAHFSDDQLIGMVRGIFVPPPAAGTTGGVVAVPDDAIVREVVNRFRQIQSPDAKIEALGIVLNSPSATDAIAKRFYDALPEGTNGIRVEASKNAFRYSLWCLNMEARAPGAAGSSTFNGHDHGSGFGDHIVEHHIRGDLAKQAAQHLRDALRAQVLPPSTTAVRTP